MYTYNAEVARVVDGDTVDLYIDLGFNTFIKERARLYGINTPETRTRDIEEKKKGLEAKQYLIDWVKKHKNKVTIKTELDKKGKYGRILATLWGKDEYDSNKNIPSANELLLENGHAIEYFGT